MLKQQQKKNQDQQQKLREEAARAVLREAVGRGYRCVELGHDGRRPIFFCIHCGTRCYTDVSLWDHLKGNVHARRLASGGGSAAMLVPSEAQDSAMVDVKMKPGSCRSNRKQGLPMLVLPPPQLQLKLIDQGQIYVKIRPCSKLVEACWFEKRASLVHSSQQPQKQQQQYQEQHHHQAVYAIVVFPYSEGLGRARNEKVAEAGSKMIVEHSSSNNDNHLVVKRGRKQVKVVERICFICRQKMLPGKEVATLLNVNNKQMMMCHSRNMRGAFHVYHTCCLINWILIFNAKQWMGQSLTFRRQFRNSLMIDNGSEMNAVEAACKSIFCPECQGTGTRLPGGQLERPRYRLAQIFEWVLQLVQSRKVWVDNLGQETTGLLFHASKGICHPRDFESSLVFPRAVLRLYSTMDLLESDKMEIDSATTTDMEMDA